MMFKRFSGRSRSMIAVASLAMASTLFFGASAAKADCRAQVSGQGLPSRTNAAALLSARAVWQINAGNSYGSAYARWVRAQQKLAATCTTSGSNITNRRHTCTFRANPCS